MRNKEKIKFYEKYKRDPISKKFYDSVTWRRGRAWKLNRNPLCEICQQEGRITPADVVHHIIPVRTGTRKLDLNFLVSLCHEHHNRIEAEMDKEIKANE
jgi:5-methylcytosine-specific restriction protein A